MMGQLLFGEASLDLRGNHIRLLTAAEPYLPAAGFFPQLDLVYEGSWGSVMLLDGWYYC